MLAILIRRYLGLELAIEGYEVVMALRGVGIVGEYAVDAVVPQMRLRYPLLGDRLVPYLIGGAGLGHAEFNDRKPRGSAFSIKGHTDAVAFTAGAGIEYFATRRIALGAETKYFYSPNHPITVDGHAASGSLQSVIASVGLRVYLFDFGH
jgi:OmpA-like transmembrane domain